MKRALVIEDQKPVRKSIGEILRLADIDPRLMGDGHAALTLAQAEPFDLITVDLNMPSLDGLSVIESLVSEDGPNRTTPLIVISAYLNAETEETLGQLGVRGCLSKPFEAEKLLNLIEQHLGNS